jgi:hypothetical protein
MLPATVAICCQTVPPASRRMMTDGTGAAGGCYPREAGSRRGSADHIQAHWRRGQRHADGRNQIAGVVVGVADAAPIGICRLDEPARPVVEVGLRARADGDHQKQKYVDAATGAFILEKEVLSIQGGLDLTFNIVHNSLLSGGQGVEERSD